VESEGASQIVAAYDLIATFSLAMAALNKIFHQAKKQLQST
jgi:hypothetical protein